MPNKLISNFKLPISKLITAISIFLLFFVISFQLSTINSQSPYEKAKADYLVQLKNYNQSKDAYITAKSNYLKFKTAVSKKEAFEKTKDYLINTNFLMVS